MNYLYDKDGKKTLFVTAREFATALHVTPMTIWRWIHEGMPATTIGDDVNSLMLIPAVDAKIWAHKNKGIPLP